MKALTIRAILIPVLSRVQRLYAWWTRKSATGILIESIDEARLFEEWEAAAYQLDEVLGFDLWFATPQVLICTT
jgi:hypothetical protein